MLIEHKMGNAEKLPFRHEIMALLVMLTTAFWAYSATSGSPFIFDDRANILDNRHIRVAELTVENLWKAAVKSPSSSRPVANLSFAANYYFNGYDVLGYRIVNILLHLITGVLLYCLVKATLSLPGARQGVDPSRWVPFYTALLWIVHPLHIQSVTYIVQRMNSMAAMFYILSLFLYVKGRLSDDKKRGRAFFAASILFGIMGLGSKQIAATLPIMIFLYEWYFFRQLDWGWLKGGIRRFAVPLAVFAVIALVYLGLDPLERILAGYDRRDFTMGQRVLTQFRVIVFYLGLIFYPHPSRLSLDHDFTLSSSLIDPVPTIFSLFAIIGAIGFAVFKARRLPLISFCILWFFVNLAIESSVIGLEIIFEHRTYLPSMTVALMTALGIDRLISPTWLRMTLLGTMALMCAFFTYQRNGVWESRVALWEDCVKKAPGRARSHYNLGVVLQEQRRKGKSNSTAMTPYSLEKEIFHFREAIRLVPNHRGAHTNLGVALVDKGCLSEAISHYRFVLNQEPENVKVQNNLSELLSKKGESGDVCYFKLAQKFSRDSAEIHNNIAVFLAREGKIGEAVARFRLALQEDPNCRNARDNLQLMLAQGGMIDQAIDQLETAIKKSPDEILFYRLGNLYREKGELERAKTYYETALSIRPGFVEALDKLAMVHSIMGRHDIAISLYKKLIQMFPDQAPLYYAVASLSARQGREGQALSWLQGAIEKGYSDRNRIESDNNFDNIRSSEKYRNLIRAMK